MSDRIRTVDMSNPDVVLDCYRKLNVAYKELKAENEKLRAALKPLAELEPIVDTYGETLGVKLAAKDITEESIRAAATALKETGDE